jgi:hypothetical protein
VLQNRGHWGGLGGPSSHLRAEIPKLAGDQHRAVPRFRNGMSGVRCRSPSSLDFRVPQPEPHGAEIRKRCVRGGNNHNPQSRST